MFEPPAAPFRLGSYEPLLELATGGMATVYAARRVGAAGFERLVVIKRVHQHLLSSAEFRDMFRDEARVASLIHHPNVVPVIDVVEWEGELLLVMEYVDSSALATLLKAARRSGRILPAPIVVKIIADTLNGLHAAHEAIDMRGNRLELVHRDVSPQNILVAVDGSSRLIDFGVAKARHRITETRSGSLKGKYAYMSPEQTQAHELDRRADLFSVGAVLYEALTGDPLFRGQNEFETMQRIMELPVPSPSACAPGIPVALDNVVHRSLARDRDKRFQTAAEMLEAVENALRPATAREVAACLQNYCADRLARRRASLQAIVEGRVAPLHPSVRAEPRVGHDGRPLDTTPASISTFGTAGPIASTADAVVPPRRASRLPVLAAIVSSAAVAGVFVALWLFGGPDETAHVLAGASSSPEQAALTAGASDDAAVPSAPASSVPAASAPGTASAAPSGKPPKTRIPTGPSPELHDNPYGEP